MNPLSFHPIHGVGEIRPGDNLARLIFHHATASGVTIEPGDVVIIKSKAVSKANGRIVQKEAVTVSAFAEQAAQLTGREPAYMELVLQESRRIVRMAQGVIICETQHGFVMANAGVDHSNSGPDGEYTLLPLNPDEDARQLGQALADLLGFPTPVLITDTFGRAWRVGQMDLAIGVSGMSPLRDLRGSSDHQGEMLRYTMPADADALAAASELVCGKDAGIPFVIVKGYQASGKTGQASDLLMPKERDLFR